jgi:hypothetical protein
LEEVINELRVDALDDGGASQVVCQSEFLLNIPVNQSTSNKGKRIRLASPTLSVDGVTDKTPKREASSQLCAATRLAKATRAEMVDFILWRFEFEG